MNNRYIRKTKDTIVQFILKKIDIIQNTQICCPAYGSPSIGGL